LLVLKIVYWGERAMRAADKRSSRYVPSVSPIYYLLKGFNEATGI